MPAETGRDGGEKTCTATEKLLCSRYSTYTVFPAEWGGRENTCSFSPLLPIVHLSRMGGELTRFRCRARYRLCIAEFSALANFSVLMIHSLCMS